MANTITESSTQVRVKTQKVVDKKMPVFYNPVMKLNRDISCLVLASVLNPASKPIRIALPLAGSGIRGIRFLKELDKKIIKEIHFNDKKENYKEYMKKNFELNNIKSKTVFLHNEDANTFLFQNRPFDYIDIDPFGTPNPFLDSAVRSLRSEGILAITATDTSALCGSYPKACKRKYWATPLRNELMHEIGLRILIRKVQMMGTNQQRALVPILSYSKNHYMRVFFRFDKGKTNMDNVLKQHKTYQPNSGQLTEHSKQNPANKTQNTECSEQSTDSQTSVVGPMWMGDLNDIKILKKIKKIYKNENISKESRKLIDTLFEETKIGGFGFFDIHKIAKEYKLIIPKFELIKTKLEKKGFKVSRTHFSDTGIKTDADKKDILKIMQE